MTYHKTVSFNEIFLIIDIVIVINFNELRSSFIIEGKRMEANDEWNFN